MADVILVSYRFRFPGGLEEVARRLVDAYSRKGHSVTVVSTDVENKSRDNSNVAGVRIGVIGPEFIRILSFARRCLFSWHRAAEETLAIYQRTLVSQGGINKGEGGAV